MDENIERAREFAQKKHIGQRYGNFEYVVHLDDVFCITLEFQISNEALKIASYLHDILEDTDCTFEEIWKEFGWEVAQLVFLVTNEYGKNRKERKVKTYSKIASNSDAITLKLCDRIANVRNAKTNNIGLFQMYKNEQPEFFKIIQLDKNETYTNLKLMYALNKLFEDE